MEDREFFEHVYQLWAKTTGGQSMYWMPEEDPNLPGRYDLFAVGEHEDRKLLASYLRDEDADFITAVHGCFGDLIRKLFDLLDENDRLDEINDEQTARIAALEMETQEQDFTIEALAADLEKLERENAELQEYKWVYEDLAK